MKLEYTYEGVTKSADLVVTVQGKTIAAPTQTNIPTYNGSDKTPGWNGYDPLKMEISGVTSASDAGSYTAIFKLSYGYLFPDGTDEARVKWTIDRAVISALPTQTGTLVAAEMQTTEPKPEYEKIIKDPYVMEFLQIQPDTHVYEGELEQALIDHLQHFLLELGRGFSFVARQKKFTLDGQNFFIDLVFYNYILKCFVLIDLKMGQLTHQDLGQMQMYINYYTRELMNEGDTPPIGIVLCADKSDAVVKYTLPEDNHQIFASKYFTYLPTEEELKRELRPDEFQKLDE